MWRFLSRVSVEGGGCKITPWTNFYGVKYELLCYESWVQDNIGSYLAVGWRQNDAGGLYSG